MKTIWNMFAGGLAWLVLGLVLLFGVLVFVELNITEVYSATSVVPIVEAQRGTELAFNVPHVVLPADGFELFTSPALMSYGLAALVLFWAVYSHHQQGRREKV